MAGRGRALTLSILCLWLASGAAGCLANDFFPEPFHWEAAHSASDEYQSADYATTSTFEPPNRTKRLRVVAQVTMETPSDSAFAALQEGPRLNMTVALADGRAVTHTFTSSDELRLLLPAAPDAPADIRVTGRGEGAWRVSVDAYAPVHADYKWWRVWQR